MAAFQKLGNTDKTCDSSMNSSESYLTANMERGALRQPQHDRHHQSSLSSHRGWSPKKHLLRTVGTILVYYSLSVSISLFNAHLFSRYRRNNAFPMLMTSMYDLFGLSLAAITLTVLEGGWNRGVVNSYRQLSGRDFCRLVLPCGVAAGLDIALSTTSLRHIRLSFYTMVKSCSPIFVLIFAFLLGLERPNMNLAAIIVLIGIGIMLTVWNAVDFSTIGFILVLAATVLSGARWSLIQLLLNHNAATTTSSSPLSRTSPLRTILYLAPVVCGTLLLLSMLFEGSISLGRSVLLRDPLSALNDLGLCALGGTIAFFLVLSEYRVVGETSLLTFCVLGIMKELFIIGLSVLLFGDHLRLVNCIGAAITILGIVFYNIHRINSMRPRIDSDQLKQRQVAVATCNVFMAIPTPEPLSLLLNPFADSDESLSVLAGLRSRMPSINVSSMEGQFAKNHLPNPSLKEVRADDSASVLCMPDHSVNSPLIHSIPITEDRHARNPTGTTGMLSLRDEQIELHDL